MVLDMQVKEYEVTDLKSKLASHLIAAKESNKINRDRVSELNLQLVRSMNEAILLENKKADMHNQETRVTSLEQDK
jgi:hypothetical protein